MSQTLLPDADQRNSLSSDISQSPFLKAFWQLVFIGVITEIVYIVYVKAYPLIPYTEGAQHIYDLEKLTRNNQWFALIFFGSLILQFYLFGRAIGIVRNLSSKFLPASHSKKLKLLILLFGLLFGFTLIRLYPITANDLFRYVLRGRIWAVCGESPMLSPPNNFPNDPYILFAGEFGDWVSGYGPLWEILVQIPLRLGATDIVAGAISLKVVALCFYLIASALIGWVGIHKSSQSGNAADSITGLVIFAWNPLVLMEGLGNGHNDVVLLALMALGVILWDRRLWLASAIVLSLAALTKATGFLMLPLFGVALLRYETTWQRRILKGIAIVFVFLILAFSLYQMMGPIAETIVGVRDMLTVRRGFAIASSLRVTLREIVPRSLAEPIARTTGRYLFILFYLGLLVQIWRRKLNFLTAAFLAYFAQLMFGGTFRPWYPIWLVPLAALYPIQSLYWRMFLFSFSGELYVVNNFLWRWWLANWTWPERTLIGPYWQYWTVINLMALPWFIVPLFGPMIIRWLDNRGIYRQEYHLGAQVNNEG